MFIHFTSYKKFNLASAILVFFLNKAPPLLHIALEHFLETLAINDKRLYHRASSIRQVSHINTEFRDLLLVTFRQFPK
ncbi:2OG-Fe dioxygenase family protein [Xenorhabdus thailandensis]|uniref:2OG-Fe dioxygenase family protein n=1 Tax=Xenorhabdus thailandensis TaxID=3136255 RepID=UPI0030F4A7A8